jgi:hypothetical protein
MNIRAQSDVVGEVPAVMIGIFIDNNLVGVPEPIITVPQVKVCHGEVEAAEPETPGATAFNAENVSAAEAARKVTMLPGMIEVVVGIVASRIMADPLVSAGVDVRRIGMALPIVVCAAIRLRRSFVPPGLRRGTRMRRRAASRNVASANSRDGSAVRAAFSFMVLCSRWNRNENDRQEKSNQVFHSIAPRMNLG